MINLHIEANSVKELKDQLRGLLGEEPTIQLNLCDDGIYEPNLGTTSGIAGTPGETKVSGSTEPDCEQEQAVPGEEQPAKTYELAEVRAAANAYKDKHGIEKLREIFKKYGGEKLKDIPEKNYAALMKEIA